MWPFHKHKLVEHVRTYLPPYQGDVAHGKQELHGRAVEFEYRNRNMLAHGMTTILFRCQDVSCTFTSIVEMFGKVIETDSQKELV